MGANVSDVRRLSVALNVAHEEAAVRTNQAVRKTALDIKRSAKQIARQKGIYDTGNLIDKIRTTDLTALGASGTIVAEIRSGAYYGIFHELGTSKMAARPYMNPATDIHAPKFEEAMAQLGELSIG